MDNLRPNAQRASIAIILIWIVFSIDFISLISSYLQYDLLQTIANGGEISEDSANVNDLREQIIGIVYLLAFIVSGVTFIQWFRRAYFNLHLRVNHLSHSEGWAAGSWFVPLISLFRPYQIMEELYKKTKLLLDENGLDPDENFKSAPLSIWWTLWIIANIIGQISLRYSLKAESIDELTNSTIISMVSCIVSLPLALVTVKVIGNYSKIEPLLHEIKNDEESPIS